MSSQIKKKFIQGSIFTDITDEINNAVSVEQARAEAAEQENADAISDEQTRAEAAEQANADDIATERGRIDAILEASTADKDSFAEVVSLINSVDTENDQAFAGHVSNYNNYVSSNDAAIAALQADVDQNEADADAAILALQTDLANLSGDGGFATDAELTAAVSAEQTRAEAAEQENSDAISAEVTRATAAEDALQDNIDVEKARIDAILDASEADKDSFAEIVSLINSVDTENDDALAGYVLSNDAALAQEISDRQSADDTLQSNINAETNARNTDVSQLQASLNAEASLRRSDDDELQANIDAEATLREDADDALSSRVDALEAVIFEKESFVLSATDISNGYIDLANEAIDKSVNFCVGRLAGFEDEDYSLNVVDGVTRITFTGSFAPESVLEPTSPQQFESYDLETFPTLNGVPSSMMAVPNEARLAMRIVPTSDGTLSQFQAYALARNEDNETITNGQLVAELYDGDANSPGTLLATSTNSIDASIWASETRSTASLKTFTFDDEVLSANQDYWLVLKVINNTEGKQFQITARGTTFGATTLYTNMQSYTGGSMWGPTHATYPLYYSWTINEGSGEVTVVPAGEEALEEGDKVNVAYSYSSL